MVKLLREFQRSMEFSRCLMVDGVLRNLLLRVKVPFSISFFNQTVITKLLAIHLITMITIQK